MEQKLLGRRFAAAVYNLYVGAVLWPLAFLVTSLALSFSGAIEKLPAAAAVFLGGPALLAAAAAAWFARKGRLSPGGKLAGLAVVEGDGSDISFLKATARYILYGLSLVPLGLGIWWAALDREGRTWPDMALGTKVVYRGEGDGGLPLPLTALYGLALAVFLSGLFGLLNLAGALSFYDAIFFSLVSGMLGSVLLAAAAVVLRIAHRKDAGLSRLGGGALGMAALAFLATLVTASVIPSNAAFMKMRRARESVEGMERAGRAAERFVADKGRRPADWKELILSGYVPAVPQAGQVELILRFEAEGPDTVFVIEHPEPGQLLLPRGLGPARACRSMRYRQGAGMEVK